MRNGLRATDVAATVLIVVCLLSLALLMRGERVAGRALAVDGDTLLIEGRRIRLRGLDAPELAQTCRRDSVSYRCGEEARTALRVLVAARSVSCVAQGSDRYERLLATCSVDGEDLGRDLVRRGLAVAYGGYEDEEREARASRRGIWAGSFETPQTWRRRNGDGERS